MAFRHLFYCMHPVSEHVDVQSKYRDGGRESVLYVCGYGPQVMDV